MSHAALRHQPSTANHHRKLYRIHELHMQPTACLYGNILVVAVGTGCQPGPAAGTCLADNPCG